MLRMKRGMKAITNAFHRVGRVFKPAALRYGGRLLVLAALLAGGVGMAGAREWSDEIQMTNSGDRQMRAQFFGAAVDSRDVLHVAYYYNNRNGIFDRQPVYQQFNKHGEPLSDPIMVGEFFEWQDDPIVCYDMYLDRDENIHLLWGEDSLYHTMFDREGHHLLSCLLEGILLPAGIDLLGVPHCVVDSQGNLVIVTGTCTEWNQQQHSREFFMSYGRWTFDGELIDTLHFLELGAEAESAQDPQLAISPEDTLHFVWHTNRIDNDLWWYSRVSPNDEIVINRQNISSGLNGEYYRIGSNILLDSENRLIAKMRVLFPDEHRNDCLIQYRPNLDYRFIQELTGEGRGGFWGKICFGYDQSILVASSRIIAQDDLGISFSWISKDGEWLDTLQYILRSRTEIWKSMRPIQFSDSTVAVLWDDSRFVRETDNHELFMRYSLQADQIKEPAQRNLPAKPSLLYAYPNPFNGTALIKLRIANPGQYTIQISNIKGEEVWSTNLTASVPGGQSIVWNGTNRIGMELPNGSYICKLEGVSTQESIMLQLIK